jgi:hypothetical protein
MFRFSALAVVILAGWVPPALAQVVIRAPFVRVQVGGGVSVRAPFVNINVGGGGVMPAPVMVPAPVVPSREQVPAPDPSRDDLPAPKPVAEPRPLTLDEFAQSFQPREGSYEVVLQNPVTSAPATVQFSLPPGTPRSIFVSRRELTFDYGIGQWVRIHFDRKGARVISRL